MRWQGRRESDNVEDSAIAPAVRQWAVPVFACQAVRRADFTDSRAGCRLLWR